MKTFELRYIGPEGSDCTAPYAVIFDGSMTVKEFVDAVLTRTKEWGTIEIEPLFYDGKPMYNLYNSHMQVDYSHGEITGNTIPNDIMARTIKASDCRAHGGWSSMYYFIFVLTDIDSETFYKEKLKKNGVDLDGII